MSQPILLQPIDRPEVPPRPITTRLRGQLVYFIASPSDPGVPPLGENEYFFTAAEIAKWLDEGVFYLVSPLDTANMTEVEITEEQEDLFGWLQSNKVQHIRVIE